MLKKILVPVDGSDISLRALDFALSVGTKFGSEILVFNVEIPLDGSWRGELMKNNKYKEQFLHPLRLAELRTAQTENVKFQQVTDLRPAESICTKANEDKVDLIVMGNRGLGMLEDILMGSVSSKVVKLAKCPVVVVK